MKSSRIAIFPGVWMLVLTLGAGCAIRTAAAGPADDAKAVEALDIRYQRAVQENDAATMAAILADDFLLVEGDGKQSGKQDLLKSARDGHTHYTHQEDSHRTVKLYGDTAVVTALLWAKGLEDGARVNYREWFSDVYMRTADGWRYVFAQASLPLPHHHKH